MIEIAAMIFIAFLAIVGAFASGYVIKTMLYSDKDDNVYILLPFDDKTSDAQIRIHQAKWQLKRMAGREQKFIVIIDFGMDEQLKTIVQKEAEESADILVMQLNELQNLR